MTPPKNTPARAKTPRKDLRDSKGPKTTGSLVLRSSKVFSSPAQDDSPSQPRGGPAGQTGTPPNLRRKARDTSVKWNHTHLPPSAEERSKNGRQMGRSLIPWTRPRMCEKLLLHIQYELARHRLEIPWDEIAHRFHPGSSGSAIHQRLNRVRGQLIAEGHLVPPPINSKSDGRPSYYANSQIRGFVRANPEGNDYSTVRPVPYTEPMDDRPLNLPNEYKDGPRRGEYLAFGKDSHEEGGGSVDDCSVLVKMEQDDEGGENEEEGGAGCTDSIMAAQMGSQNIKRGSACPSKGTIETGSEVDDRDTEYRPSRHHRSRRRAKDKMPAVRLSTRPVRKVRGAGVADDYCELMEQDEDGEEDENENEHGDENEAEDEDVSEAEDENVDETEDQDDDPNEKPSNQAKLVQDLSAALAQSASDEHMHYYDEVDERDPLGAEEGRMDAIKTIEKDHRQPHDAPRLHHQGPTHSFASVPTFGQVPSPFPDMAPFSFSPYQHQHHTVGRCELHPVFIDQTNQMGKEMRETSAAPLNHHHHHPHPHQMHPHQGHLLNPSPMHAIDSAHGVPASATFASHVDDPHGFPPSLFSYPAPSYPAPSFRPHDYRSAIGPSGYFHPSVNMVANPSLHPSALMRSAYDDHMLHPSGLSAIAPYPLANTLPSEPADYAAPADEAMDKAGLLVPSSSPSPSQKNDQVMPSPELSDGSADHAQWVHADDDEDGMVSVRKEIEGTMLVLAEVIEAAK